MQSSRLQIKAALTFVLAVLIAACAAPTAVVHDIDTNVPCPEWTTGQLGLAISVVPIAVPGTLIASEGAVPEYGIQARRISIAVKPPRAEVQAVTDLSDPQQLLLIPRQDLGNIPRMQKGLHSRGCKQIWLAAEHEKMILNMHQEMDRYLR